MTMDSRPNAANDSVLPTDQPAIDSLPPQTSIDELRRQWRTEFEQELAESRTREHRLERELASMRALHKEELLMAALRPWAVDLDTVLAMTQAHIMMDGEGRLYPVDAHGARLMDGETPVTLDAWLHHFRQ